MPKDWSYKVLKFGGTTNMINIIVNRRSLIDSVSSHSVCISSKNVENSRYALKISNLIRECLIVVSNTFTAINKGTALPYTFKLDEI